MPHAFADVLCNCSKVGQYHCFSHDSDEFLEDFNCPHFRSSFLKRAQFGIKFGFDQLAGLYFDVTC